MSTKLSLLLFYVFLIKISAYCQLDSNKKVLIGYVQTGGELSVFYEQKDKYLY